MDVASARDSNDSESDEVILRVVKLSKRVILKVMKMVRILVIITIVEGNQHLVEQGKYKVIGYH